MYIPTPSIASMMETYTKVSHAIQIEAGGPLSMWTADSMYLTMVGIATQNKTMNENILPDSHINVNTLNTNKSRKFGCGDLLPRKPKLNLYSN